jgi:hypothetical protein
MSQRLLVLCAIFVLFSIGAVAQNPNAPSLQKSFGAATILIGASTSLTFTMTNPEVNPDLTGVNFSDTLPAGLVVATPNGLTESCGGGTITATAGTNVVSLTGGTLPSSFLCTISVNVTGIAPGVQNNTTSTLSDNQGLPGAAASATITVLAPPPTITKAFADSELQLFGAGTALSFAITNPNAITLTSVGFTDTLPAGLVVSTPNGLTAKCGLFLPGGGITAVAGSNSISLSGATLPAGASCTFSVNVTGTEIGVQTNTTSTVTSNEAVPGGPATATTSVDFQYFLWFFVS